MDASADAPTAPEAAAAQRARGPLCFPLPDDLLLDIFGRLDVTERRAVCLVCRRWCQLADHPTLQQTVAVIIEGPYWAQRYLEFAAWLPLHARHVRQLSVCAMSVTAHRPPPPSDEEEGCASEATAGLLAACVSARQLTALCLQLGCRFQQGLWLPALRTLRLLCIITMREAAFRASLALLTGLEELELGGVPTDLADSIKLPSSLTALHLRCVQVAPGTDQLRPLRRLRSLHLSLVLLPSEAYNGLIAVSGSLRTLVLARSLSLPACLPQLTGLEALCISDFGRLMDHSQGEPEAILAAALRQMTGLTRLALGTPPNANAVAAAAEQPAGPSWGASCSPLIPAALPLLAGLPRLHSLLLLDETPTRLQLPAGLSSLRQLAAPAMLLACNLAALKAATSLQLLGLLSCDPFFIAPEPEDFWDILGVALQLPELNSLLIVTRDEMADDARTALARAAAYVRTTGRRPLNPISLMIVPNAFDCLEISEMANKV